MPGFRLSSIYEAKTLTEWRHKHKIGHDEVKGLNGYIKIGTEEVILLKRNLTPDMVVSIGFTTILFLLLAISLYLWAYTYIPGGALVTFKQSQTNASIEAAGAIPVSYLALRHPDKAITAKTCQNPDSTKNPFTLEEKKVICDAIKKGALLSIFSETTQTQRKGALILIAVLAPFLMYLLADMGKAARFIAIRRKVERTAHKGNGHPSQGAGITGVNEAT